MGLSWLNHGQLACIPLVITLFILVFTPKKKSAKEVSLSEAQTEIKTDTMEDLNAEAWMASATTLDSIFNDLDKDIDQASEVIKSATNSITGSLTGLDNASTSQQAVLGEMIQDLIHVTQSSSEKHDQQTEGIKLCRGKYKHNRRFYQYY